MTNLELALLRVTFGPALKHWNPQLKLRKNSDLHILRCTIQTSERNNGKPIINYRDWATRPDEFDSQEMALSCIYALVRDVVEHELEEAWLVDNVRVKDPHATTDQLDLML